MNGPRVILKYQMDPGAEAHDFELPIGSTVLHFDIQQGMPTLWIEQASSGVVVGGEHQPTDLPKVKRRFVIVGTGMVWQYPGRVEHIGSAHSFHGDLVLHCYEVTP